jgi:hypothetical protein
MRDSPAIKKLVEELLPICKDVQTKYRPGRYISVKWVDGNQRFDAEISQRGARVDHGDEPAAGHLEVTGVMHQNDYLLRELIDKGEAAFGVEGVHRDEKTREIKSEPVVHTNNEFIDAFCPLVLGQITREADIAYPKETTLVVRCLLGTLYMPEEWNLLMNKVRIGPDHDFREIFLFDPISEHVCSFYRKIAGGAAS